jgi:hypothetical protein
VSTGIQTDAMLELPDLALLGSDIKKADLKARKDESEGLSG